MSDLKNQLIKLGSTNPELRPHIRAILTASRDTPLANLYSDMEKGLEVAMRNATACEKLAYDLVFQSNGEDSEVVRQAKALLKNLITTTDELDSSMTKLKNLKKN